MPFRSRLVAAPLLTLGVAAAAAAPASAAALTYTVKIGNTTTGAATLAATSSSIQFFSPGAGISPINCTSLTSTLSTTLSTAAKGNKLAKLTNTKFGGCETRDDTILNVTSKGSWVVSAVGTTSSSGVTSLALTKVQIAVKASDGACSYDLKGSLDATYTNGGSLTIVFDTNHTLVTSKFKSDGQNHCEEGNNDKVVPLFSAPVTAKSPTGMFSITSN